MNGEDGGWRGVFGSAYVLVGPGAVVSSYYGYLGASFLSTIIFLIFVNVCVLLLLLLLLCVFNICLLLLQFSHSDCASFFFFRHFCSLSR